jgi:hypothetical protein
MDGWVGGWVGGRIEGQIDGWMDGWADRTDRWMDGWADRRTDGCMEGRMDFPRHNRVAVSRQSTLCNVLV